MPRVFRLALFLLLALPAAADAHPFTPSRHEPLDDYTIATWGERDGVPPRRIRTIGHDSDGYLWLATDAGLIRFDGARFDEWRGAGSSRLPSGAATALLIARDRSKEVAVTGSSPIAPIPNGALTLYWAGEGPAGRFVLSFARGRSGAIWAAPFHGGFS